MQAQAVLLCLPSSRFPCELLSTQSLPPTSAQLGKSQSRAGRSPLFLHHQDPGWRICPGHLPQLSTREVSVRQVYQGTRYIWIQMILPEWLLLRALRVLAPDSQQWTQQAAGTHVRTREGVWGSPFLGWNLRECCSLGVSLA